MLGLMLWSADSTPDEGECEAGAVQAFRAALTPSGIVRAGIAEPSTANSGAAMAPEIRPRSQWSWCWLECAAVIEREDMTNAQGPPGRD
jgi:hypothetical protein